MRTTIVSALALMGAMCAIAGFAVADNGVAWNLLMLMCLCFIGLALMVNKKK